MASAEKNRDIFFTDHQNFCGAVAITTPNPNSTMSTPLASLGSDQSASSPSCVVAWSIMMHEGVGDAACKKGAQLDIASLKLFSQNQIECCPAVSCEATRERSYSEEPSAAHAMISSILNLTSDGGRTRGNFERLDTIRQLVRSSSQSDICYPEGVRSIKQAHSAAKRRRGSLLPANIDSPSSERRRRHDDAASPPHRSSSMRDIKRSRRMPELKLSLPRLV